MTTSGPNKQSLSIAEILHKSFYNTLPSEYLIKDQRTLSALEIAKILAELDNKKERRNFLENLCTAPHISLSSPSPFEFNTFPNIINLFINNFNYNQTYKQLCLDSLQEFIENHTYNESSVVTLLYRFSPHIIHTYFLRNGVLPTDLLIKICNNPDKLKILSENMLQLLYDHLSVVCPYTEIPALEICYLTSRLGHVLGLKGKYSFKNIEYNLDYNTEGEYQETSISIISEHLEQYCNKFPTKNMIKVKNAFEFTKSLQEKKAHHMQNNAYHSLYRRCRKGELVIIPTGWPGHTIAIVLYGDYLIYCNRGSQARRGYHLALFNLKESIDLNMIMQLVQGFSTGWQLHKFLEAYVNFQNPLYRFRTKPQKYGTCTYANPKSAIEAMLPLLESGPFDKPENVRKKISDFNHRKVYKHFSNNMRSHEIGLFVKRMKKAKHPMLIDFYTEMAKKILTQHPGKSHHPIKELRERKRAQYLIRNLPKHIFEELIKDQDIHNLLYEIKLDVATSKKILITPVKPLIFTKTKPLSTIGSVPSRDNIVVPINSIKNH